MSTGNPQGLPFRPGRGAALKPALIVAAAIALLAAALVVSSPPATEAAPSYDTEEARFLQLINEYRAQNGRGPLVPDPRLDAAADWFANDMAIDNYWAQNHQDNENPPRGPGERAAAFGFNGPVGENLAAGFTSADAVFQAWRNSPGHNSNMLGDYAVIGIGRAQNSSSTYGVYWVTDFSPWTLALPATPAPTNPPPPPATNPPPPPATEVPTLPPTAVPTAPPTAAPTAPPPNTPAPTPLLFTPNPTATPHPPGSQEPSWGDTDCDGVVGPVDSIRILRVDAGLQVTVPGPCPPMTTSISVDGVARTWGDIDCNGAATALDSLLVLQHDAGFGVILPAGCPAIGQQL